jgi:hypothetical protein
MALTKCCCCCDLRSGVRLLGIVLGSILQNSISAESFSDKLGRIFTQKQKVINLSEWYGQYNLILRYFEVKSRHKYKPKLGFIRKFRPKRFRKIGPSSPSPASPSPRRSPGSPTPAKGSMLHNLNQFQFEGQCYAQFFSMSTTFTYICKKWLFPSKRNFMIFCAFMAVSACILFWKYNIIFLVFTTLAL